MSESQQEPLQTPTARIYIDYEGYEPKPRRFRRNIEDFEQLHIYEKEEPAPFMIDGPSHPGEGWTRFVCISDTHSECYPIPRGDVLLHAGDLSSWGQADQLEKTVNWIASLEGFQAKVLIAGNHDLCLDAERCKSHTSPGSKQKSAEEMEYEEAKRMITRAEVTAKGVHYLEHGMYEFTTTEGKCWKVYGSPATPRYALGAFQYVTDGEAKAIYKKIPENTEILLTHTPPHRILDITRKGRHAGCHVLRNTLDSGKLKNLKLHVFGHIHEGHGAAVMESGTVEVNGALAWGGKPIIVDLKN
ncbi:hypothetical protein Moror_14224 [Moniliophthora roreri MCA 2997]|uniref:Calcineurin-like phosphoesterase domain-containing protein n=1 Tax=Moniliophthora roreri (strain MCA 2997) TaxID=1381753 RepID=V2YSV0_MONRO|nr:hypothetical protein Moror_14224 [Moniliophthora roreri MCA 2997]